MTEKSNALRIAGFDKLPAVRINRKQRIINQEWFVSSSNLQSVVIDNS